MFGRKTAVAAALCAMLLLPASAFGAGFAIFEGGAKALGMAGAFTAQANDPSAIFFNPAGLARLQGNQVYLGTSLIFVGTEFAGVDPDPGFNTFGETGTLLFTPINGYVTSQLNEQWGVGLGVYNPYGLGQEWEDPDEWVGRHIASNTQLVTFFITPTVAYAPNDRFSFGAGLQLVHASVELSRSIQRWDPNGSGFLDVGETDLTGNNGLDVGFSAGLLLDVSDDVTFGASFRSGVSPTVEGDADFTQKSTGDPAYDAVVATQLPSDQGVSAKVKLPWFGNVAVAYSGVENWVFEIDFNYFGWENFDELTFEFDDDPSLNTSRVQDYENELSIRTGASYQVNEDLQLRGGYYYDPTPQPEKTMSPLLGDVDRHGLALGFGYDFGSFVLDTFGLILLSDERSSEAQSLDGFNGTYKAFGNLFGFNVGFDF